MNLDLLCAAVQEAPQYLRGFNRREYADTFKSYAQRFGPAYMEAVRETGGSPQALEDLAEALLDRLEQGWRRQHFWNRSVVRTNEKQAVVAFLSPLLLGLEEPLCLDFAKVLRDRWTLRWPRDSYRMAPFQTIQKGFRNAIMGIEIPTKQPETDDSI